MSLYKALNFVPRRAMASKPPPPPPTTTKIKTTTTATTAQGSDDKTTRAVANTSHQAAADDDDMDKPIQSGQTSVNMNRDGVGFKSDKYTHHIYLNPLLTPPPRSPRTPEDFMHPTRLGHWVPLGFDYTSPLRDKYIFHEILFFFFTGGVLTLWLWSYGPDFKDREWARREAFLRTTKREALGLPLIDRDVIDPARIVLPPEEQLKDPCLFKITQ